MQEPGPGTLRTKTSMRWKDDFVCYYEVEKGGMFNLNDFYMYMWQWHIKEQFQHWGTGDNKIEDFYLHRIRPDGVQENLVWWRTCKRINPYIYYFCKMDWENFGSKSTEIVYNDKKIKTEKVGLVLRVWWWVQIDPFNKWERSVLKRVAKWFYTYLLHMEMENHRDKCREIAKRQENEIKTYWEMHTNVPMPRSWFPEAGYKWERPKPRPEDFENMPRKGDWQI
jgi:hypothetical protein